MELLLATRARSLLLHTTFAEFKRYSSVPNIEGSWESTIAYLICIACSCVEASMSSLFAAAFPALRQAYAEG
jgi:hypothetical protein